jgi:hypothetical protein
VSYDGDMKQLALRSIGLCALLLACATAAFAEESNRGFYEGNLAGGGRVVFFVQANHSISSYLFDIAGHQASFAGGPVGNNGTFNLTTSANQTVSGTISADIVNASFLGQSIVASRMPVFGGSDDFAGRFTTTARSDSGASLDVKILIDSQNRIFLVTKQGSTVLGGFGTITVQANPSPSPSPSPGASPSPSPSPSPTASPSPNPSPSPGTNAIIPRPDDHGDDDPPGDDRGGHHGSEDSDDAEDRFEDRDVPTFAATFTVTFVTGQTVTGNLAGSRGLLLGDLTLNGVTYRFRAPQQSADNHLANISTRGFVNTGQGQLIGGFIIRGGPKLVVVRATGPSLAAYGVSPTLANPALQLFNGATLLRENDNWQRTANANELIASGLAPTNPNEAAIVIRLEPGAYTTVVTGVNNDIGIALVEVFEVDRD